MEFSKKTIIFIVLYATVSLKRKNYLFEIFENNSYFCLQCQSVVFILLSMLSILSYYCIVESPFALSKSAYMIHLMYFKSYHCGNNITWSHLGVFNSSHIYADRPDRPFSVELTFDFSILYLSLYSCLILSCIVIYCKYLVSFLIFFSNLGRNGRFFGKFSRLKLKNEAKILFN